MEYYSWTYAEWKQAGKCKLNEEREWFITSYNNEAEAHTIFTMQHLLEKATTQQQSS